MAATITSIVTAIVTAFTEFLTGIGSAIVDFFETIFIADGGGLTTAAIVSLVFIGVSFAMWIVRKVTGKVGL